jgi:hypothetical protein
MAVGDRLIQPVSPTTGAAYAPYEVTSETGDSSGYKQAALLIKPVGDDGSTVTPLSETTFTGTMGEVQATPTTNTVLRRLKDLLTGIILAAGENHVGAVGGHTARVSATFTRPSDTTPYASGDLVANNTVASSVTPMSFAIGRGALGKGGMIRRVRLRKSGTSTTNAQFRLHLYSSSPTQTGAGGAGTGDNAAWSTDGVSSYVGAFDITVDKAFTDGAAGNGAPMVGSEVNFTADTYYGLLEARGAYTPANGETIEVLLEVIQN